MPLNEFSLIDRYFRSLAGTDDSLVCGIGDDAAVLRQDSGEELVISTDTLVEDVHFFADAQPADIGYKALAVNLSDLAAMGARPRWVTLALTLPVAEPDWVEGFSRGFAELARTFSVSLVGGDISRGPLSITCQVLGTVPRGKAVYRHGARPGDGIYVTGKIGLAAVALELLKRPGSPPPPDDCLQRLLRPVPRVRIGELLRDSASAMIDLSDGLAGDLDHILKASGTGAEVELEDLPVPVAPAGLDPVELLNIAISGGDDYELCFTVPAENRSRLQDLIDGMECGFTRIGRITEGAGIRWLRQGQVSAAIRASSYQHF